MFGISLVELIFVMLLVIFFVKPADIPQIARFLGKIYSKIKNLISLVKENVESTKKEVGFDQIKQEFNIAIDEEEVKKGKNSKKTTEIVDIYGKTHHVMDISQLRPDLEPEDLENEIESLNQDNQEKSQLRGADQEKY